jgi:SAM-dependent methyltransferase
VQANDVLHYQREKTYWDHKGADDYAPLSDIDRTRVIDWIGWQGQGRILDIGGGAGMVSRLLMREPDTDIVCLDISAAMLSQAPVPGIQADALQLPLADGAFKLVVAAALLHHLPGFEADVLRECARVLAPGGRLVGYDPNGHSLQNRVFMGDGPLRLKRFTPDERPVVPESMEAGASAASFSSFEFEYFTFENDEMTMYERVQRYAVNPVARGPLRKYLDRWFFWRADR